MADAGGAKKAPRKGGTFLKPSYTINESKTRWEDGPMDPAGGAFWRNADASQFQTRFGANYKKTGRKESSLPAMYAIKSCDVFHSHTWVQSLAPMFDIPEPEHDSPLAAEGIPTNISTTILVPYIDTGMFGAITEGPTIVVHVTAEMTTETVEAIKDLDNADGCYKLLVKWLRNFRIGTGNEAWSLEMASRLKIIGIVNNWDELKLPGWLKGYNAKPVLIKKSGEQYCHPDALWMDELINVHKWSYIARKGLCSIMGKVAKMKFSLGGCVEAREDENMPERMMFAVEGQDWPVSLFENKLQEENLAWLNREAELAGKNLPKR